MLYKLVRSKAIPKGSSTGRILTAVFRKLAQFETVIKIRILFRISVSRIPTATKNRILSKQIFTIMRVGKLEKDRISTLLSIFTLRRFNAMLIILKLSSIEVLHLIESGKLIKLYPTTPLP